MKELKYFKYIGITGLNFGRTTPQIKWVSRPTQNVRGLWTHIGLEYEGCITVSIEISGLNLLEDAVNISTFLSKTIVLRNGL